MSTTSPQARIEASLKVLHCGPNLPPAKASPTTAPKSEPKRTAYTTIPAGTSKASAPSAKATPASRRTEREPEGLIWDERVERTILGIILQDGNRFGEFTEAIRSKDFALDSNRKIWDTMLQMEADGQPVDAVSLPSRMGNSLVAECGGHAYLASLTEGLPNRLNPAEYIRILRTKSKAREACQIAEAAMNRIAAGESPEVVCTWAAARYGKVSSDLLGSDPRDWRSLFHTFEEFRDAPPVGFAVAGILPEHGINLIGALAGQSKTLVQIAMTEAMLNGTPLFGYFSVPRASDRVLYLVPECGITHFWARLKLFHLEEHVRTDRLLVRTLSSTEQVSLTDPRILQAAQGADIFLDTAVRFMDGAENDVEPTRVFAQTLFALLGAGARTITGAHHAPKGFETQDRMTLENILRGSGDIGAMVSTAWGLRQIDAESNRVYIENVKARDFLPCQPFVIEGRPHLDDTGHFKLISKPGEAGELRTYLNRQDSSGKQEKKPQALEMHSAGKSIREIGAALQISKSTIGRWIEESSQTSTTQPEGRRI